MKTTTIGLGVAVILAQSAVHAEEPPQGLMKQDAATSGSTDVESKGFQAAEFAAAEESKDATDLALSAGALLASGNSKTAAGTAAGRFRLRRDDNQVKASAAINYAQASTDPDEPMEQTVDNSQTNLRYDRFLSESFTLFASASTRRDRFQKIDLRLNLDPGFGYYLISDAKRQLWAELGYDYQYELRSNQAVRDEGVERKHTSHNGRAFLGYDDKVNDRVAFTTGFEYIQALTEGGAYRLAWDVALTSNLSQRFSTAVTFSLQYNNQPLPEVEKTDATTAISLVYSLL
jgi:putative salt-induced outer membrane protein